jgi:hypothetical protein
MTSASRIVIVGMAAISSSGWLSRLESPVAAQEQAAAPAADGAAKSSPANELSADEKEQLRIARRHVQRLKMRLGKEGGAVDLIEQPLLAFGDAARGNSHGTLWAFGASGRPDAFMELWQLSQSPTIWYQSFIRTGNRPLSLQSPDGRRWQPPDDKVVRTPLDGADSPAASQPGRLRQLRSLARRFTAHESGDADHLRTELRLLAQPVRRYDDRDGGIQDGAAFLFAHDINPEAILLVEALGSTVDASRWHYSLFPTTSADLHVELDGKEVWMRPGAPGIVGRPTDDYWLFSLPVEAKLDDEGAAEQP